MLRKKNLVLKITEFLKENRFGYGRDNRDSCYANITCKLKTKN